MDPESEYVSVEEAASFLGVSTATVRRRCGDGTLVAEKVGRSWLVDRRRLIEQRPPPRRSRPSVGGSSALDFSASIVELKRQDLVRDVWVPDILNFQDELSEPSVLIDASAARIDGRSHYDPAVPVAVPKTPIFLRNACNLSLADRLAYHAVVRSLAPRIEARTRPGVFSARLDGKAGRLLEPGAKAWVRWRRAVQASLDGGGESWMVEADVTSYFDCIQHGTLITELQNLAHDPSHIASLRTMLRTWGSAPGTGLPQGPDASRVLANFYLHPVDEVMSAQPGVQYFRFMDDFRIVAATRREAIDALRVLDVECRRRNLFLSTKKTQLMRSDEARNSLRDDRIDRAKYAFDHGEDPAEKRRELKALFRSAVRRADVESRRAKFSLYRLRILRDRGVLGDVLRRLEDLANLGWLLPAYLLPWLRSDRVITALESFLHDSERNTSEYLSTWLLAATLDEPHAVTARVVDYSAEVGRDPSLAGFHRVVAFNVMALGGRRSDLAYLEEIVDRDFNPELVRGAVVALHRVGKLTAMIRERSHRIEGLEVTTSYLQGRNHLPSLIHSAVSNEVGLAPSAQ